MRGNRRAKNVLTHVWLSDNRSRPPETLIVPRSGRCRSAVSYMGDCSMAWFVGLRHFAKANFDRKRWVSRALNLSEFPKPMGNTGNECCRTRSWADRSAIPQPISQLPHVVFRRLSYRSRARRSSQTLAFCVVQLTADTLPSGSSGGCGSAAGSGTDVAGDAGDGRHDFRWGRPLAVTAHPVTLGRMDRKVQRPISVPSRTGIVQLSAWWGRCLLRVHRHEPRHRVDDSGSGSHEHAINR